MFQELSIVKQYYYISLNLVIRGLIVGGAVGLLGHQLKYDLISRKYTGSAKERRLIPGIELQGPCTSSYNCSSCYEKKKQSKNTPLRFRLHRFPINYPQCITLHSKIAVTDFHQLRRIICKQKIINSRKRLSPVEVALCGIAGP